MRRRAPASAGALHCLDYKSASGSANSRDGPISAWRGMTAGGLAVGGDVERALGGVNFPSYVLDASGIVRWINPATERLLGDIRGRHYTSVIAPEDEPRARELITRKLLSSTATDATGRRGRDRWDAADSGVQRRVPHGWRTGRRRVWAAFWPTRRRDRSTSSRANTPSGGSAPPA
jgi:hypothetical protein